MAGTSLDVPHSFVFTQTGNEHICKVRVTMPDDSVQNFEATCTTKHAARVIAIFRASYAVRLARKIADADPEQEDASAPLGSGEASKDSASESLDVDSRESQPHNDLTTMVVDTPFDHYSSSAEEDDDDDNELRVDRRRNTLHTPIAFVPAPDTPLKSTVETEGGDALKTFDKKSSFGRSSLGDAKSQHVNEVLDAAPLQERFREFSDVEEEEQFEPSAQTLKFKGVKSHLTPRKRKHPPAQSVHSSVRKALRQPSQVPSLERRTRHFRSEPVCIAKAGKSRKGTLADHGSIQTTADSSSKLPSSENVKSAQGEPVSATESIKYRRRDCAETRHQRRTPHNAELPLKNASFNRGSRIPRLPTRESCATDAELDVTQNKKNECCPTYQHQAPPPGPMSHPPHPGQIHEAPAPFSGHSMFREATQHPMGYASQYTAMHIPSHPPHMSVAYPAPPPMSYGMSPSYMPQPGFPPPVMGQTIGPYPYPQPLPNGAAAFYHAHAQPAYPVQLHENQNAQREAEIRATAEEVAAKMAAEAAAKDAAKKAQSDFEADEAKRANRAQQESIMKSGKKERKSSEPTSHDFIQVLEKKGQSRAGEQGNPKTEKSAENEVIVSSIAENDGDQEDYVSKLHKMSQKGKMCTNLSSPTYVAVPAKNRSRCSQQCTMSVRFAPDPDKEGTVISKTVAASRKKIAKQLAAKEILAEIDKRLESQPQTSDEEVGSREKASKSSPQKKNLGITTTAVAALHRLYTLNSLCGPPIFKPEEPSGGGDRGNWRSVILLDVKDFGKHQFEDVGPSKKMAKQRCAFKAFEALKTMKVPGVESFTNVTKDGRDAEQNKTVEQEDAAPIDAIVEMSEDEKDSNSSIDAELAEPDDRLSLPKNYNLVFPKNEYECEQWFKENSQPGSHLGLFVDSPRARTAFATVPSQNQPRETKNPKPAQPRFLCLSTASSGIVLRFPESPVGLESESTDDSDASLPEVVVETLEDAEIKKFGFACEAGMSVLEDEEGFRARAIDDVSMISLAITGTETAKHSGPLASLPELTRHWMKKEVGKISEKGAWREKSDMPTRLREEAGRETYIGVLASYVCFCISQHMKHAARQKRTRAHGVAAAFLQLSEQVMSSAPA